MMQGNYDWQEYQDTKRMLICVYKLSANWQWAILNDAVRSNCKFDYQ